MNFLKEMFDKDPFSINKINFNKKIFDLTSYHYMNSSIYKSILKKLNFKFNKFSNLEDFPFLPITLFKDLDLISVPREKIIKTLLSSGTSGVGRSKIYLDKDNSINQVKTLKSIMSKFLGHERLPMLIIDKNPKLNNKASLSARSAAIYGFSIFGKNYTYLLNEKDEIDYSILNDFLEKFYKDKFLIFGFTNLVYENLIQKLDIKKISFTMKNSFLLHGGGWKKMEEKKISNFLFKKNFSEKFDIKDILNYYGLIEQTGSIYVECPKCNSFITSIYSDVLIRDNNFNLVNDGSKGLIQLFSLLPSSYPGHNIITEDMGAIVKKKHNCKIEAKHFVVYGRSPKSETRGCSDV